VEKHVEIRIGIAQTHRDVVIESNESYATVAEQINEAIKSSCLLSLTDERGRTILIPGDRIAFVEIGAVVAGRVGFANA
jgi:polysaccharide deacetylase 2 family uncharacterized protein YibQ